MNGKNFGPLMFGAILFFVFIIVGYVIIMCSRLFLFPTKTPRMIFCTIVGLAAFMMVSIHTNVFNSGNSLPKSKTNDLGYNYEIDENKVTFMVPPTKEEGVEACWTSLIYAKHWEHKDDPIYVIGKVDGKNKKFYLSTQKDKVVNSKLFGKRGEGVHITETPRFGNTDGMPYNKKYYYTNELWTFHLPLIAVICIVLAHLQALSEWINAANSRTSMGQA